MLTPGEIILFCAGANDARRNRLRNQDLAEVDGEIAGLVDRSTQELRRAWGTGGDQPRVKSNAAASRRRGSQVRI
jgi:hypothetical protein